MTSRRIFNREQFFFIVLVALIISGALRLGLEFREREERPDNCQCRKQDCVPFLSKQQDVDNGVLPNLSAVSGFTSEGPFKSLKNAHSWELPADLSPGFHSRVLDPSRFCLTIKVLTYDRGDSAERCLLSLENALYDGDTVDLEIYVDHPFGSESKWSADFERKVGVSHQVLERVEGLPWTHGQKRIHYRTRNGGIQLQWLEAWWPSSLNDFAFVVEDDMELSPVFYRYFKHILADYYYNQANFDPQVYGVSFQRQLFVAGIGGRTISPHRAPFLYQLIGTWGQFLFPVPWKRFRKWYDMRRYNVSRMPVLENLKTTQWWFNKGNRLWTPWIIKWAHAEHMYNIYTSFPGNLSLSISHREIGSNFRKNRKADAKLLLEGDFVNSPPEWTDLPPMHALHRYDFCYHRVKSIAVSRTLEQLKGLIDSVQKANAVALIIVPLGAYDLIRNWLCHVDALKVQNYVLVVSEEHVANDLAKRGHPVHSLSLVQGNQGAVAASWPAGEWGEEQLRLVTSVLAMGYNVVACGPDTLWLANPFPKLGSAEFDMQGAISADSLSKSFLFVQSSAKTIAAWDALANGKFESKSKSKLFLLGSRSVASRLLSSSVSFQEIHTLPFASLKHPNSTQKLDSVPVVLGLQAASKQDMIARLALAGLWAIDDYDLACRAVPCRTRSLLQS